MMQEQHRLWQDASQLTRATARSLRHQNDFRSCASRAYYAAYQMATAICIEHGDTESFPSGWNNPAHDQLPELIKKNGNFSVAVRRRVIQGLRLLRDAREDADYRMGNAVDETTVRTCITTMDVIFELLEE